MASENYIGFYPIVDKPPRNSSWLLPDGRFLDLKTATHNLFYEDAIDNDVDISELDNAVKLNTGTNKHDRLTQPYVELTPQTLTSAQLESLRLWFDTLTELGKQSVEINIKKYDLKVYNSDELIKIIKRYKATGKLLDNKGERVMRIKFIKDSTRKYSFEDAVVSAWTVKETGSVKGVPSISGIIEQLVTGPYGFEKYESVFDISNPNHVTQYGNLVTRVKKVLSANNLEFIAEEKIEDATSSDVLYILTRDNHRPVSYEKALEYGDTRGLEQVFMVDKKEFKALAKQGKEAFVRNPDEWAFNRLHLQKKTKPFGTPQEFTNEPRKRAKVEDRETMPLVFDDQRIEKYAAYGWTIEEKHEFVIDLRNRCLEEGYSFKQYKIQFELITRKIKKVFDGFIETARGNLDLFKDKFDKSIEDDKPPFHVGDSAITNADELKTLYDGFQNDISRYPHQYDEVDEENVALILGDPQTVFDKVSNQVKNKLVDSKFSLDDFESLALKLLKDK